MSDVTSLNAEMEGMKNAVRHARLTEAAYFDSVLTIRDAQTLRLQVLKDELLPLVASLKDQDPYIDLVVVPGDPPRLWVDPVSWVVMEPNPQTYRLVQDSQAGRQILLETPVRADMVERLKLHFAHRVVLRERQLNSPAGSVVSRAGYSGNALLFSWLSGFAMGALILLLTAWFYLDFPR